MNENWLEFLRGANVEEWGERTCVACGGPAEPKLSAEEDPVPEDIPIYKCRECGFVVIIRETDARDCLYRAQAYVAYNALRELTHEQLPDMQVLAQIVDDEKEFAETFGLDPDDWTWSDALAVMAYRVALYRESVLSSDPKRVVTRPEDREEEEEEEHNDA